MLRGKVILKGIVWLAFLSLYLTPLYSQETHTTASPEEPKHDKKEKFSAQKFLFEHISDEHEWHIATINDKHISIPLPVILISKSRKNIFAFFSSKLEHGHTIYKGFKLETEGEYKGKIIEIAENGRIDIPIDLSITKNVAALFCSVIIILWMFLSIGKMYKRNTGKPPKGLQSLLEPVILFIRDDIAKPSIGEKKYEKFTPYLLTIFFFIWFNNMLGLVPIPPGGADLTGNIAVTGVLAFFTLITTNISANKNYWKHIFNTPGVPIWLKIPPVMPLIELFGIFTKPFVLMVRLFANITAGHLITLGFLSLIFVFGEMSEYIGLGISPLSIVFLLFMFFLELLVAFIQAFVFTFLSALYIGMAVEEHH